MNNGGMREIERRFEELTGKRLTDVDARRLHKIKEDLRLGYDDALWSILLALEMYQKLYGAIPKRIRDEAEKVLASTKSAAEAVANEAIQKAHLAVAKSIAETAQQVARDVAVSGRARSWRITAIVISVSIVVVSLVFTAYWHFAYRQGRDDMRVEMLASDPELAWLNSETGQEARRLSEDGTIDWLTGNESAARMLQAMRSRLGLVEHLVNVVDCSGKDGAGTAWRIYDRVWCVADGQTVWPYHPQ